ncbi:hypothetical protein J4772_21250 [Cohnella sp. LGH]|uniref:enolase C-terminal domain-like protein n=1 Tax=Cohnella sp. LGH TaxID=1619153 RepID=UPI001ADA90EB|nr:enolase C-terminal domain-like protein [Cohnella sp. LGH]QTH40143.1 hypothetical protein J4772_21250 [Cohnella sp. LGH]
MIRISETEHGIMKEPLLSPFGFKGDYLTELWQSVVGLRAQDGTLGIGVGVQSVLWSDPRVFMHYGEASGNRHMADLTQYALKLASDAKFHTPLELVDRLFPDVYEYGRKSTGISDLRATFVLNALVAVDQAAWGLYSRGKGKSFEELVPDEYRPALSERQQELANIPVVGYGLSEESIEQILREGYFLLKIKIGADPDRDGDQDKMLAWDQQRLSHIHDIASRYETTYTRNGKIAYYLDANGRYDGKERMLRFLEHADRIGALERIVLVEEPFDEADEIDVSDVPVRLAADESVHDERDARIRIDMGYGAIALKPVAKTMSVSLKVAKHARDRGIPCFCADLTANPVLADWNKTLASYLSPLPELKIGAIEMNGRQNYRDWDRMKSWHPYAGASWTESLEGIFRLDESFYAAKGGALEISPYYEKWLYGKGDQSE